MNCHSFRFEGLTSPVVYSPFQILGEFLKIANYVFTAVFILEAVLKIYAIRKPYFKDRFVHGFYWVPTLRGQPLSRFPKVERLCSQGNWSLARAEFQFQAPLRLAVRVFSRAVVRTRPLVRDACLTAGFVLFRWNILDVIIVVLSIVGIVLEEMNEDLPINPTIIRVMRVLRIARGVSSTLPVCLSVCLLVFRLFVCLFGHSLLVLSMCWFVCSSFPLFIFLNVPSQSSPNYPLFLWQC